MKKIVNRYKEFFIYTGFWFLIALVILGVFVLNNKSFVFYEDGTYQHFNAFYHLCDATERWMSNGGHFDFYSFHLGQGGDLITTLNSYDFTDPISIICSLCLFLSRVNRYTLMIFIKLWLIGISFIYYLRSINKKDVVYSVIGALIYTFATVNLYSFARHPNYINWAYFLPFILGSVELYKNFKLRIPLIIVIALNVINSYYTFFMNAILTFIYVFTCSIVKCLKAEDKKKKLTDEIIIDLKLLSYCLVGIGVSTVVLLPTISAYLNNARIAGATGYTDSLFHYPLDYYVKLFELPFASYANYGYYTHLGISPVLFVTTLVLFIRKGNEELKTLLIICLIMICVPLFGRIMNGFGYACNRWSYAFVFFLTLGALEVIPLFKDLNNKQKKIVLIISILYVGLCMLHFTKNLQKIISLVLVLFFVFICLILSNRKYFKEVLLASVVISLCLHVFCLFSPLFVGYSNSFAYNDELEDAFINSSSVVNDDREFYRIETAEKSQNMGVYNDTHTTTLWYSLLPHNISDYYYNLGIIDYVQNCNFTGLDGRSTLLKLASVKYYTKPKGDSFVPSGFILDEEMSNDTYEVYLNTNFLPIAYTYDNVYSYEDVKGLNGIQKELLMLQGSVIDTDSGNKPINADLEEVEYRIKSYDGLKYEDEILYIEDNSAYIELETELSSIYETYVYFGDIDLIEDDEVLVNLTLYNDMGSFTRSCSDTNLKNRWPAIKKELSFYLGNNIDGNCNIRIGFSGKAKLKFSELSILRYDPSMYLSNLNSNNITNVVVEDDMVSCHIELTDKKFLQFSIPYSKGWEAYVDGVKTRLEVADYMYMGFYLDEGLHEIELRYVMPYYKDGMFISLGFVVLAVLIGVRDYRTKRDEKYGY